ncbi:MAG TPA: septum formation protein Maf [Marinilabiliaceae bacterium]|nr:septum formation protein Maf [Marinilabiliaceae bacterium]
MPENLRNYRIILASQSPRRQELLRMADVDFEVLTIADIPEDFPAEMPKSEVAEYLALKKIAAYKELWTRPKTLVIAADTIVVLGDDIMNKPADREEAIAMLKRLSDSMHTVLTGVAIRDSQKERSFTARTNVYFKKLKDSDIEAYVDRYKPYDKAGGYGVQEYIGLIGVYRIEGSFYNVMGLPVSTLYEELCAF